LEILSQVMSICKFLCAYSTVLLFL
jgi:hypothetical protein